MVPENTFIGTRKPTAGHRIFYGHDAKEDDNQHPESEVGWEFHADLTL